MSRDATLRMAREAGLQRTHPGMAPEVLAFAALVRADEREECAKLCEAKVMGVSPSDRQSMAADCAYEDCADTIRARSAT